MTRSGIEPTTSRHRSGTVDRNLLVVFLSKNNEMYMFCSKFNVDIDKKKLQRYITYIYGYHFWTITFM